MEHHAERTTAPPAEIVEQTSPPRTDKGAEEPDWGPLEKVMPHLEWCAGFAFSGYRGGIRVYRHGFTGRYLNVDPAGITYLWLDESGSYIEIPLRFALAHVFAGLEDMGVGRSTPLEGDTGSRSGSRSRRRGGVSATGRRAVP